MKSSIATGLMFVSLLFSVIVTGQVMDSPLSVVRQGTINRTNKIPFNVLRNFVKDFNKVTNESWRRKVDGYRATFTEHSIKYMADYDLRGRWTSTIRIYNDENLPKVLRKAIRIMYLDYSIIYVTELKTPGYKVHFAKLEDKTTSILVRIIDDEYEIIERFLKN